MRESTVQNLTRLEFANIGPIWRNNSGAFQGPNGQWVRYGLGNDSSKLNKRIKSSDLIGITPVTAYVASLERWAVLGVLTALEVKEPGWVYDPRSERETAQKRFHSIVRASGGFAGFVTNPDDIHNIILRG